VAGPQLIVNPTETTTYTTVGSGLDLCESVATTTIYMRENFVGTEDEETFRNLTVYPNPSSQTMWLSMENGYSGPVSIVVESVMGQEVKVVDDQKTDRKYERVLDNGSMKPGLYFIRVKVDGKTRTLKWMKL
jgi:hypothetical protein